MTRLPSNLRPTTRHPRMRAFSYAWSFPVTWQTWVTPFDQPYPKPPCYTQTSRLYVLQKRSYCR